ncbi:hypothetical protein HYC85_002748 [Camellia sinensis]|uniref:Uncharacterized protein n=1 Tax=Camellia sinensis TaxID=4442 RepID=A0A7J7I9D0_CAMSI|nr:hypothetical protein HYC85_002748 [Camellia sinensis]
MTSGSFFPNHHGTRLLQFSGSQPYTTPTASIVPTWSRDAKHHQELYCTDQQCAIPNSLACIYKGVDKRFPFFLVNDPERSNQVAPEVSISQRLGNDCGPAQRGRDHQKFFSADSKCALSLFCQYFQHRLWELFNARAPKEWRSGLQFLVQQVRNINILRNEGISTAA